MTLEELFAFAQFVKNKNMETAILPIAMLALWMTDKTTGTIAHFKNRHSPEVEQGLFLPEAS
jgi:hypothetical protein